MRLEALVVAAAAAAAAAQRALQGDAIPRFTIGNPAMVRRGADGGPTFEMRVPRAQRRAGVFTNMLSVLERACSRTCCQF